MKFLSDFKKMGFSRTEITSFLAKNGVEIQLTDADVPPIKNIPDWKKDYALVKYLDTDEAAHIICGINPDVMQEWNYWDNPPDEFLRKRTIIHSHAEDILGIEGIDRREFIDNEKISQNTWSTWCRTVGLPWLDIVPEKVSDQALFDKWCHAEEENVKLQKSSEEKQKEIDHQRTTIDDLTEKIKALMSEISNLKNEQERLKKDLLQGKNKTSYLKLISTLAQQGYRVKLSNGRISEMNAIVTDSQRNGTSLDEKTVRNILTDALKLKND